MKTRYFISVFLAGLILLTLLTFSNVQLSVAQTQSLVTTTSLSASDRIHVSDALQDMPLMFIENVGQFDESVRFQVRGGLGTIWLTDEAIWMTAFERPDPEAQQQKSSETLAGPIPHLVSVSPQQGVNLKLSFIGANPHPRIEPFNRVDTPISYFIGNDPTRWRSGAPVWGGIRYVDFYPGIDLELTGASGQWIWRLMTQDSDVGANSLSSLQNVRLRIDGAEALALDNTGFLRLTTAVGEFALPLLGADQVGIQSQPTQLTPRIEANEVIYPISSSPTSSTSVSTAGAADLLYSTFLGGNSHEYGNAVIIDWSGAAYVVGSTWSANFPTRFGAFDPSYNGSTDAFVVKLHPSGNTLLYATFLGGSGNDCYYYRGCGMFVDGSGTVYVTGDTASQNFPTTTGAFDRTLNGPSDAFMVKLNPGGSALVYATLLGGNSWDGGRNIVVDGSGAAYASGWTWSSDFPTTIGAFDRTFNGGVGDAFVVKLNVSGNALTYATFLGGSDDEGIDGLVVDATGAAYVVGSTSSSNFPTTAGAYDTSYNGSDDAFVAKLDSTGSGLVYATFLGGNNRDSGANVSIDGSGALYVTGETRSSNFPTTPGAYDRTHNGNNDAYAVKLNGAGSGLIYATFLGGSGDDRGHGLALDANQAVYLTGYTTSANFPTTTGAYDPTFNGGAGDAFVAKLNATASTLAYATFLGGNDDDLGYGLTVDGAGNAYLTGYTNSYNFPTQTAFDIRHNGYWDVFVTKLAVRSSDSPPPSDKPPIVFVHGWAGWPPFPLLGPCDWPDPDRYFESVDDYLRAAGYHIEYAHLETSRCYTPPLTENIWRLQNAIALAKSATHQTKVILIAHSMGGLVSRAYIEDESIYAGDVAALFTFGTPHLGVPSDLVALFLDNATLGVFCRDRQPAVCDFSEAGMRLFNRNHTPRSHEVDYHLISGNTPFFSRNFLGWLTDPLIPGPDDGITPTNSGLGGNHPSFFLDRFQTDENHNLFGPRSYFIRDGGPSLSYTECLQPVLVSHSGRENCGSASAQQITTQDTSTLTERTPFEYGTLQPGQTATRNLSLEGGATLFATRWQTGTLTVTLVDPNSQTIDPTYAASHPDIVTYNADANVAIYYFPNAIAGQWQLKLQANSDVSVEGSAYTTFAAFESAISLTGQTDRDWYVPGATATFAASLSGSPTSATITATVLDANGAAQSISLSPVGGGNYQGSYTVPNVPGYAEVRLVATGVTASGVSFERGKNLVFQISPNSISLNDAYSDAPQPRASNPSLYEALNVTVGINAAVSGRFGLSADLMDASGNFVAHSLTIENINPGPGILTLRFEGNDIYASGRNGPYTLTNLLLTDQRNTTLAVVEAMNVYTTAAYDYRNFVTTSIYLPIIVK
jgi:pimeloyl-ACP methyl ester carboxylesterase